MDSATKSPTLEFLKFFGKLLLTSAGLLTMGLIALAFSPVLLVLWALNRATGRLITSV